MTPAQVSTSAKSPLSRPESVTVSIVRLNASVLVRVTVCVTLAVPRVWSPKERTGGASTTVESLGEVALAGTEAWAGRVAAGTGAKRVTRRTIIPSAEASDRLTAQPHGAVPNDCFFMPPTTKNSGVDPPNLALLSEYIRRVVKNWLRDASPPVKFRLRWRALLLIRCV